jgi:uncharacterized protein YprB with RNaseH-like and TPR domain
MADELEGSVAAERAPQGTPAYVPPKGNAVLVMKTAEELERENQGYAYKTPEEVYTVAVKEGGEDKTVDISEQYLGAAGQLALTYKPIAGTTKAKPEVLGLENHVAFDLETTGVTPFDSKLVMATFWVLTDDKADMVTFADPDEELLAMEIADFLDTIAPEMLIGFNTSFDVVFISSRLIKYHIGCKALYESGFYDLQDWAKRGASKYLTSSMKSGTLEDWAVFLFGEQKAYTVEECLMAYEEGDITPFYIRNRQDVALTGDMYKLIRYVEAESGYEEEPTELRGVPGTETKLEGTAPVICPICQQTNTYDYSKPVNKCFICSAILPEPGTE